MKIFRLQISVLTFLLASLYSYGQKKYNLYVHGVDNDSAAIVAKTGLQISFPSYIACVEYINKLPDHLQSKGFVTASIDSLKYDSGFARITIFLGELYQWAILDAKNIETTILDAVGWREKCFPAGPSILLRFRNGKKKF